MDGEGEKHVRRKRYRGSHPRSFSEKYKEHDPERYKDDIEHILARGDTPAGTHRSIMVEEILGILRPREGEIAIDATLGYGGHAAEVLKRILPGGRLYGFDRDLVELEKASLRLRTLALKAGSPPESFVPVHESFAGLARYIAASDIGGCDVFLADLGLSSMQIDDPERGFTFKRKGPLDMRMDTGSGSSARDFLRVVPEKRLAEILSENADEARSPEIAHAICLRRGRIETTRDLAEAICSVFPDLAYKDPAMTKTLRRSFQAIRIEVNGEFTALESLLSGLPSILKPGARAAFLSFHSGEDGRVEAALKAGLEAGIYSSIAPEAIRPGHEERFGNPRSASAKLRWAIRA